MEVACGEYGDNVPKLVVALKAGKAKQFQSFTHRKMVNCSKTDSAAASSDKKYSATSDSPYEFDAISMLTNPNLDLKETAILDDNIEDIETGSILSGGGATAVANGHAQTATKVTVNSQNGACDTLLVKLEDKSAKNSRKMDKNEKHEFKKDKESDVSI